MSDCLSHIFHRTTGMQKDENSSISNRNMKSLPYPNPKLLIPSKEEMVDSRINRNKRARTDAPVQDDVNDDIDNAMAIIRNRLFTKALEVESLEARVEQTSKDFSAAMSRFQQLSNDNAVLEEENEDQAKKIEKYRFQLSSIRKEMEKSISRAEERCKQFSVSNAEKDVLIAWYEDKVQSLLIDKTSSITRAKELHQRVAEGWDNRAETRELTKANLMELVGK